MIGLGQILTGLVQRTAEGKLKWNRSVSVDRFVTSLDAISIVVMETTGFHGVIYSLDILDEMGQTIETLSYGDTTEEQDRELERLFVLARRSAHNIDVTLEKLAKALEL